MVQKSDEGKGGRINQVMHTAFISTTVCVTAYLLLIANGLTNTYDGLWHGSVYTQYSWVISLGRWFWPAVGLARINLSPEPLTSVLSVFLTVLGGCALAEWFDLKDSWKKYLVIFLSVINTAVCASLTYRYMSPTFAAAYLLSVLGIFVIREEQQVWRIILAVMCLTLSLACYQADIGCACLLVLINVIRLTQKDVPAKKILRFFGVAAASVLLSFICYKVMWDIALKVFHLQAAAYNNAGSVSIGEIFRKLPETLPNTYKMCKFYYFEDYLIKHNAYQRYFVFKVLWIGLAAAVGAVIVRTALKSRVKAAVFVLCILLIPAAVNVSMIVSGYTEYPKIQQTMPLAVVLPFLACVMNLAAEKAKANRVFNTAVGALLSLALAGNVLMVSIDQQTLLSTKESSLSLISRVAADLDFSDEPENGYVFLGKIYDNPSYRHDDLWWRANEYAQYGNFFIAGNGNYDSYNGLLRDAAINLELNADSRYWHELEQREEIKDMPVFPQEGYIKKVDDVIIVKISNFREE